ncbi:conserved hypothetical protein [Candidatus Desulfarcum epimagneticum]|uniref:Uncharacterized protein n=1 Tax=uncultured Desulfobacteraceae bacterium TaxID=218296 RepID=A0A484HF32_9BACT|nr:conserved hypothetical protein [uncultured Desulfobacteraceae bacterium]
MKLEHIAETLKDDFETSFEAPDPDVPVGRVLVRLPLKSRDDLMLEMMFVPGVDKHIENSRLLQLFVYLSDGDGLSGEKKAALVEQIARLNVNLVGSLGYNEKGGFVYYKYILMAPKKESDETVKILRDAVWLSAYLVDTSWPHLVEFV